VSKSYVPFLPIGLLTNVINYQELINDTVIGLEHELFIHPSIVKVEVEKKGNSYDFQLTANQEFLSDEVLDDIFELVIDVNFDLRQKIGDKIYFKHSFVGVRKYYVEDEEFDSLSSAYEEASKQLDGDWLTEEGLTPYQLIEVRDI
jgi:hypothetical protein